MMPRCFLSFFPTYTFYTFFSLFPLIFFIGWKIILFTVVVNFRFVAGGPA